MNTISKNNLYIDTTETPSNTPRMFSRDTSPNNNKFFYQEDINIGEGQMFHFKTHDQLEIVIVDELPFDNIPNNDNVIKIKHSQISAITMIRNTKQELLDDTFINNCDIPELAKQIKYNVLLRKGIPKIILNFICCSKCKCNDRYIFNNAITNSQCLRAIIDALKRGDDVHVSDFALRTLIEGSVDTEEGRILFGENYPLIVVGETLGYEKLHMVGLHRDFLTSNAGQLKMIGEILEPLKDRSSDKYLLEMNISPTGSTALFTLNKNWNNNGIIKDCKLLSVFTGQVIRSKDNVDINKLKRSLLMPSITRSKSCSYKEQIAEKINSTKVVPLTKYKNDYVTLPGTNISGLPSVIRLDTLYKGCIYASSAHWKDLSYEKLKISQSGLLSLLERKYGRSVSDYTNSKLQQLPENIRKVEIKKIASNEINNVSASIT